MTGARLSRLACCTTLRKLAISSSVLYKQGPLTDEEWAEMRHPEIGWAMLSQVQMLGPRPKSCSTTTSTGTAPAILPGSPARTYPSERAYSL